MTHKPADKPMFCDALALDFFDSDREDRDRDRDRDREDRDSLICRNVVNIRSIK